MHIVVKSCQSFCTASLQPFLPEQRWTGDWSKWNLKFESLSFFCEKMKKLPLLIIFLLPMTTFVPLPIFLFDKSTRTILSKLFWFSFFVILPSSPSLITILLSILLSLLSGHYLNIQQDGFVRSWILKRLWHQYFFGSCFHFVAMWGLFHWVLKFDLIRGCTIYWQVIVCSPVYLISYGPLVSVRVLFSGLVCLDWWLLGSCLFLHLPFF